MSVNVAEQGCVQGGEQWLARRARPSHPKGAKKHHFTRHMEPNPDSPHLAGNTLPFGCSGFVSSLAGWLVVRVSGEQVKAAGGGEQASAEILWQVRD